jgi:hypothetical protein
MDVQEVRRRPGGILAGHDCDDKDAGIDGGLLRPREGQSAGTINTIAIPSLDETIKKIEQAAEKFAYQKWRSRKWAGWSMRKIRREMSLA